MAQDSRSSRPLPAGKRPTRVAPASLTLASALLLAASFVPGRGGEWVYLLVAPLFPVLLIRLAVERRAVSPAVRVALPTLAGMLVLSVLAIRILDGRGEIAWLFGLPASALVMALGLVVLPLLFVGLVFAATYVAPEVSAGGGSEGNGPAGREA